MSDPSELQWALGTVDTTSARFWVCALQNREIEVVCRSSASSAASAATLTPDPSRHHTASVRVGSLHPDTEYVYELRDPAGAGRVLGGGRFRTLAPSRPPPWKLTFGMASCHLPFSSDGSVQPHARDMLRAARTCLRQRDARALLLLGDQMYTDMPSGSSLFSDKHFREVAPPGRKRLLDCTPAEIADLLAERYRWFWSLPEWQSLMSDVPTYPMWDDHELIDNFGSLTEHDEKPYDSLCEGAWRAYVDFQQARVGATPERGRTTEPTDLRGRPEVCDYVVELGPAAVYVLDIRSQRTGGDDGRVISDRQHRAIAEFLDAHARLPAVFVVLTVPIAHLPTWPAEVGAKLIPGNEDFSDRWASLGHQRDRDQLLQLLESHRRACPEQHMGLLSGDIHVGCAHRLRIAEDHKPVLQLVSSALTNRLHPLMRAGVKLLTKSNLWVSYGEGSLAIDSIPGAGGRDRNPYGDLNLGIVELWQDSEESAPGMRFELWGHEGGDPVRVFDSGEL